MGKGSTRLRQGNTTERVHRLVQTHWIRTLLVTAYGILMFWMATTHADSDNSRES